jgi:hypothetical protein
VNAVVKRRARSQERCVLKHIIRLLRLWNPTFRESKASETGFWTAAKAYFEPNCDRNSACIDAIELKRSSFESSP